MSTQANKTRYHLHNYHHRGRHQNAVAAVISNPSNALAGGAGGGPRGAEVEEHLGASFVIADGLVAAAVPLHVALAQVAQEDAAHHPPVGRAARLWDMVEQGTREVVRARRGLGLHQRRGIRRKERRRLSSHPGGVASGR